ncbi:hypothetical protein MSG28_011816 [Choristoneura fumiferana]|uniref:Uncharacterized protein n=1 Tax=Choristoneura fumiferana TaxID=7141 RepID=A0ACC0KMP7_CHOFU|nr:hypothetical protein MSG28_011816 [Choristoneura fumiferana]
MQMRDAMQLSENNPTGVHARIRKVGVFSSNLVVWGIVGQDKQLRAIKDGGHSGAVRPPPNLERTCVRSILKSSTVFSYHECKYKMQ